MKNSKKLLAFLLSACMVCAAPAVISGCKDDGDGTHSSETEKNPEKLKEGVALSLRVGESSTITVSEYIKANGNTVTVNSSSNGVVTATLANGTLTVSAANEGTANVTLTCKSVTVTFNVTVAASQSAVTPVFDNLTKSLDLNLNTYVEVTLAPKSGADGLTFEYSQKIPSLITGVEISGNTLKFTPTGTGSYEITVNAHCTNNAQVADVTFTVTVTVTQQAQVTHTVTIDGGAAQQYEHGYSLTLPTTTTQQAPNGKQFSGWKLGEGSTVSPGSTITVESDLVITPVFTDIPQQDPVKIGNIPDQELRLATGTVTTTVNLANYLTTNGHTVSVSSEDSAVATVGESGGTITITAVGAGATTVTVNCKDEQLTFDVTVKNALPAFENGVINIDRAVSDTGTYEINPVGAATYSYSYSVTGATVSKDGEKDVLSYTATSTQDTTLTVNVTATDSATNAVENLSFTVQVNVKDTSAYRLFNGDFEEDDNGDHLTGWTLVSGEAFGAASTDDKFFSGASYGKEKDGTWLFTGANGGTHGTNGEWEAKTGTLRSRNFTLQKNGWISFRLGGAHNVQCGIRICAAADGEVLAEFNNLNRGIDAVLDKYKFKFSGMDADTECYIEIFDDATGGWGLVVVDDIQTYCANEPQNAKEIEPYYSKGNKQVQNGGFNNGLAGWLSVTNEADKSIGFIGAADATWGDGTKSYNNDGAFFQNGDEIATGYLLSSVFEVSDNGWMTFKLGGNKAHSYVAVVDAQSGAELAKFVNESFVPGWPNNGWEMYAYKVNLIESGIAAGTKVQIKVVDNGTTDYGVIVADSFVTDYSEEPAGVFEKIDKVTA